nr:hypothetical protein [Escherichia coli]
MHRLKTPIPSSQLSDAKTGVNYEFITIAANYVNGMWLVDGRQRPVIKTSMTKRNYLQIEKRLCFNSFKSCNTQN